MRHVLDNPKDSNHSLVVQAIDTRTSVLLSSPQTLAPGQSSTLDLREERGYIITAVDNQLARAVRAVDTQSKRKRG